MLCHAEKSDLEDLEKWSSIIKQSSRCGLGKTSTNRCLLARSDLNKAFDLEKVTQDYDTIINEIEKVHG